MQRNARLRNLKFLRFPTLLLLLGAIISLSNCRTVAEPTGNSNTSCARNNDEIYLGIQRSRTYEQASGLAEPVCRTALERNRQIIEESATSSADLLIEHAEDVSANIKNAQIYCEEVQLGWLDIEVEILSGLCEPDCIASSFLQGRVPWLIRGDFFRTYQERDSFENWVHHPEVFRGISVMRVDFAADGTSIDSSIVLEEKRGGFDTESWFIGMAESAELENPVGDECAVRVIFKANLANFSGHYNHRH